MSSWLWNKPRASIQCGIDEGDLRFAEGARHHAHVCDDCGHRALNKEVIVVMFEVYARVDESGFDDVPGASDFLEALVDGLPREWFTNDNGADWWVQRMMVPDS